MAKTISIKVTWKMILKAILVVGNVTFSQFIAYGSILQGENVRFCSLKTNRSQISVLQHYLCSLYAASNRSREETSLKVMKAKAD